MRIEFMSNFDRIAAQIIDDASDTMHEALAEQVAATARENGMIIADGIELEISDDSEGRVNAERVRARANQILAGD